MIILKLITDKKGNVKKTKTKEDKEIEVDDELLKDKDPEEYRIIKQGNTTQITPKVNQKEIRKNKTKNKLKNVKNVEEKLDLIISYLGLN